MEDGDAPWNAALKGRFDEYLQSLPDLNQIVKDGKMALLHIACRGPNARAVLRLLTQYGMDVNHKLVYTGCTPLDWALLYGADDEVIKILCAAGAKVGYKAKQLAFDHFMSISYDQICILIANGMRVNTNCICKACREAMDVQRRVDRCRAATVAMIRVKRAGSLQHWDRFLLREMAFEIWKTRVNHW